MEMEAISVEPTPAEEVSKQTLKSQGHNKPKYWAIAFVVIATVLIISALVATLCFVLLKPKPNYIVVKPKLNIGARLTCSTRISIQSQTISDDFQLFMYPMEYGSDHTVFLGWFVKNDTTMAIKFSQNWINGTIPPDVCVSEKMSQQELETVRGLLTVLNCSTCNNRVTNEEVLAPVRVTENAKLAASDLLDSYKVNAEIGSVTNATDGLEINIPKMEIDASCSNVGVWSPSEEWVTQTVGSLTQCVQVSPQAVVPQPSNKLQPSETISRRINFPEDPLKIESHTFSLYAKAEYTGFLKNASFSAGLGFSLNGRDYTIKEYKINSGSSDSPKEEYDTGRTDLFSVPYPLSVATLRISVRLNRGIAIGIGAPKRLSANEYTVQGALRGSLQLSLDAYVSAMVVSAGVEGSVTFKGGAEAGAHVVLPLTADTMNLKCSWYQYESAPVQLDVDVYASVESWFYTRRFTKNLWQKYIGGRTGRGLIYGQCSIPPPMQLLP